MEIENHVKMLLRGPETWNQWRTINKTIMPDLRYADLSKANLFKGDLSGANLSSADLSWADLRGANLRGANLCMANLYGANLRQAYLSRANLNRAYLCKAHLREANLSKADLCMADLREANLFKADLRETDLSRADLSRAYISRVNLSRANLSWANLSEAYINDSNLEYALVVDTNFSKATINDCRVYGVSAWGVNLDGVVTQSNLRVTPIYESNITVDNLEVAQFIYLLLHNGKIRDVIDTIGQKGVLILGRFSKRKDVLDAIRNKLREFNYVPMMFDFERPTQRDFTETIKTLAGMCRFIIADITNPKSSPLELQATVPDYMIPFVPIIHQGEEPFSMFVDIKNKYDWVLDVLEYDSVESLIEVMEQAVIKPALDKAAELVVKKARDISIRHANDYR